MDDAVREVLEFLIINGAARNETERDALLAKINPPAAAEAPAEAPAEGDEL